MALQVIGAGYGRTGTLSLKLALEQLGFGPCHHMMEVFAHPETIPLWIAAADGQPDWEAIFDGYGAAVDWPTATFYRGLAEAYPEAKVILTERDPDSWFASTQATIFGRDLPQDSDDPWVIMAGKVIAELFGRQMHDRDRLISVYQAHNAKVREVIPPERLLVYRVTEGWAPLCAFLGVPVPDAPMPRVNSTEEFHTTIAHEVARRAEAAASSEPA